MPIAVFFFFLCSIFPVTIAAAPADSVRGREVAEQAFRSHFNYRDVNAHFKMIVQTPERTAQREGIAKAMLLDQGRSYSLVTMTQPKDILGYSLLTHSYSDQPDDQWLYKHSSRKTVRLNATNRGQPFLGSDFSFQDLGSPGLSKFNYHYMGEEKLNGQVCLVIERLPTLENTGYSRQLVYYHKEHLYPLRIIYYDNSGQRLKTQDYLDYQLLDRKHWRALENRMTHHARNTSTRLLWSGIHFDTGLTEKDFQVSVLTRRR